MKKIFVSDTKYYLDFGEIRLVYEEDCIVGWYRP